MVAEATITDALTWARDNLVCNCRRVMVRPDDGQVLIVKTRSWDCPSCGYDKRKRLAEMVGAHGAQPMFTLTFRQPRAIDGAGRPVTPPEHERCERKTHVYRYSGKHGRPGWRWRTMANCPHCIARLTRMKSALRKRLRRRYGETLEYLYVLEDQDNGALHVHLALAGLPELTEGDALYFRRVWGELGGGRSQIDRAPVGSDGHPLGSYLGKYLAKEGVRRVAAGCRRWGRTRQYAPEVRMRWVAPEQLDGDALVLVVARPRPRFVGWQHPIMPGVILGQRVKRARSPAGP